MNRSNFSSISSTAINLIFASLIRSNSSAEIVMNDASPMDAIVLGIVLHEQIELLLDFEYRHQLDFCVPNSLELLSGNRDERRVSDGCDGNSVGHLRC